MKAIDLFPYWADNRALLAEIIRPLKEHDLEFRPAVGQRTIGDILRHVITAEEYWWRGGILGEPFGAGRPADWDTLTDEQKAAYRRQRFPTLPSILQGLQTAHEPMAEFLARTDAAALCEKRRATWEEDNTLRWILWHLVEHDQHHRGQIYTRLRLLGYDPPSTFPRPAVMATTPAAGWQNGEEEVRNVIPFWKQLRSELRDAVATLEDRDLGFRPAAGLPSIHDLILHVFIWEDFLVRQNLNGEMNRGWWKIHESFWKPAVESLAEHIGVHFPSVASLLEGLDTVRDATHDFISTLTLPDLTKTHETPWGSETMHHTLWYAREHMVHHRAQIFLRMRMIGRTPPEI
ncbi:MAG: DinB family protein [Armatimonadota bacterium]